MGNDCRGPTGLQWKRTEGLGELLHVVAVHFFYRPAKGAELVGEWIEIQDILYRTETLDLVLVPDGHQVVELVLRRKKNRLPVGAFVQLAVTEQHKGAIGQLP